MSTRGVGGGGLEVTLDLAVDGGDDADTDVASLLFLLNCSYILYRENTDTVAGVGKGEMSVSSQGARHCNNRSLLEHDILIVEH